jgi:multidrug efflux pump subunit AcrB
MRLPTPRISRSTLNLVRERLNISRIAIRHAKLTIGCWVAIAIIGLFALNSLKYALFPDITFPVVVVSATISPESSESSGAIQLATAGDTEARLTIPLEEQLRPIEGLRKIASSTFAGRSVTNLRFRVGESLSEATGAVEQRIAQADFSPQIDFEVIPLNLNEATVASYAIFSEQLSLAELADLAQAQILSPLRGISGVLRVDLLGTGTFNARSDAGTDARPDARPDANRNTSGETASSASLTQSPTLIRFDGQTALALQIVKQGDANTLEVARATESAIQQLQETLPNVSFALATTQADYIQAATQATIDSLVGAVVITVLVIFGFLRSWRATLITALAIPLSLLGTFIVMRIFGFNLETITLLALALVIGIIVDDAIVEVENVTRHIELGQTPRQATLIATQEIWLAVSASTLTIAAVFLPVAFMGGTVGQFFKPFGLTVSAAVLISLLVARTLSPVLSAYWLKPKPRKDSSIVASEAPEATSDSALERSYSRLLYWALHHRWVVVGIAIASFIAGIALIPFIPQGFIPQLDQGEFYLNYTVPIPPIPAEFEQTQGDPRERLLQQTFTLAEQLETQVFEIPEVESVLSTVGAQGRPNQGRLYIKLKAERDRDTATVQTQLRQNLSTLPDVITSVENVQFVETGGEKPLQVALLGDNLALLNQAATEVKAVVEKLPGFVDVQASGAENTADRTVEINRENGQRVTYISANLTPQFALGDATDQVVAIAQSIIPPEVRIDLGSDSERTGEVLNSFGRTFVLAVICMLAVIFVPFGRLLEPTVVALSLPLSVVGAVLALLVTQSDFGIVSLLGLLFLLGLLDKNALLLIDYANQLRRAGMKRTEALLKTGRVRLRPILMTTASTVLGMLPLALGLGAGAELRQPMAVAIIGGLLTSTLLSLVVVPVLYSLLEDGSNRVSRRLSREHS